MIFPSQVKEARDKNQEFTSLEDDEDGNEDPLLSTGVATPSGILPGLNLESHDHALDTMDTADMVTANLDVVFDQQQQDARRTLARELAKAKTFNQTKSGMRPSDDDNDDDDQQPLGSVPTETNDTTLSEDSTASSKKRRQPEDDEDNGDHPPKKSKSDKSMVDVVEQLTNPTAITNDPAGSSEHVDSLSSKNQSSEGTLTNHGATSTKKVPKQQTDTSKKSDEKGENNEKKTGSENVKDVSGDQSHNTVDEGKKAENDGADTSKKSGDNKGGRSQSSMIMNTVSPHSPQRLTRHQYQRLNNLMPGCAELSPGIKDGSSPRKRKANRSKTKKYES